VGTNEGFSRNWFELMRGTSALAEEVKFAIDNDSRGKGKRPGTATSFGPLWLAARVVGTPHLAGTRDFPS
jgi:hypothetical protein